MFKCKKIMAVAGKWSEREQMMASLTIVNQQHYFS